MAYDYLSQLNPAQKEAVITTDGPLLVTAGAGSGKTRVITYRILHLLVNGVAGEQILAITFTNKAGQEMCERVTELLRQYGYDQQSPPHVSTFHSLGVSILREFHEATNRSRHFTIFDRKKSEKSIKRALKDLGYDPKQWSPRHVLNLISDQKNRHITLEQFKDSQAASPIEEVVGLVWPRYQEELQKENAYDFDDLLAEPVKLLEAHDAIKQQLQERWSHLHVDEYQDTNAIQHKLVTMLAPPQMNVCAVGDEDQTIYTWRGAEIENILRFPKVFDDTTSITLEQNYRSKEPIITAANQVIKKNAMRKEKSLRATRGDGELLDLFVNASEHEEAQQVMWKLQNMTAKERQSTAILYRTNFQSRIFEEQLIRRNIPYQVVGTKFFDRKEIRDVLSYLRLAANPDATSDLRRIINRPRRGIGAKTQEAVLQNQRSSLSARQLTAVKSFFNLMDDLREQFSQRKPSEFMAYLIDKTGLAEHYASDDKEASERVENMRELVSVAAGYDDEEGGAEEKNRAFLESLSLFSDQDTLEDDHSGVKLMTVHAAKGLEFDTVFVVGLEDGLFPQDKDTASVGEQEEERRLFYVALTRAREKAYLSYARSRTVYGSTQYNTASPFIEDIDQNLFANRDAYDQTQDDDDDMVVFLDGF